MNLGGADRSLILEKLENMNAKLEFIQRGPGSILLYFPDLFHIPSVNPPSLGSLAANSDSRAGVRLSRPTTRQ
jgi:hypothetical protein